MFILPEKPNFVSKWEPTAWRFVGWRFVTSSEDRKYVVIKHPFTDEIAVLINEAATAWRAVQINMLGPDALQQISCTSTNDAITERVLQVRCPACDAALTLEFREFVDFDASADSASPFLMPVAQCDACALLVLFPGDDIVTIPLRKE